MFTWVLLAVRPNLASKYTVLTPQHGQYLTHAHNHITLAAMDSCFRFIRAHQHGIGIRPRYDRSLLQRPLKAEANANAPCISDICSTQFWFKNGAKHVYVMSDTEQSSMVVVPDHMETKLKCLDTAVGIKEKKA